MLLSLEADVYHVMELTARVTADERVTVRVRRQMDEHTAARKPFEELASSFTNLVDKLATCDVVPEVVPLIYLGLRRVTQRTRDVVLPATQRKIDDGNLPLKACLDSMVESLDDLDDFIEDFRDAILFREDLVSK